MVVKQQIKIVFTVAIYIALFSKIKKSVFQDHIVVVTFCFPNQDVALTSTAQKNT